MMPVAPLPVIPLPSKRKLGFLIADIVGTGPDDRRSDDEEGDRGKTSYTPSPPPAHSQKPDFICGTPPSRPYGGTPPNNAYASPYEAISGRPGLVLPFSTSHARPQDLYHPGYGPPPTSYAASLNPCPLRFPPTSPSPVSLYFVARETCQLTPWRLVRHPRFGPYGATGPQPSSLFFHKFHKPKRVRTAFSPSQLLSLEHAFEKNQYVVGAERKDLARNLGLTETQVKVWFQNRRTKHKRQKQEESEQHTRRAEQPSPDSSRSPGGCQRGEQLECQPPNRRQVDVEEEGSHTPCMRSTFEEGTIDIEDRGIS